MREMTWNDMEVIGFNTGRKYTPNGQRIIAIKPKANIEDLIDHPHEDYFEVFFCDIDRNIDGRIFCCMFTQQDIMRAYDHGQYIDTAMPKGFDIEIAMKTLFDYS